MKPSAEEKRRSRLHELAAKLKANGESSLTAILGWGSLRWGSKSERVREHLQDLENAGLIDVAGDEISWVGGLDE